MKLALIFLLAILLTSCTTKPATPKEDLNGTWKYVGSPNMEATFVDGVISIYWVSEDGKSIYWVGSCPKTVDSDKFSWISDRDASKTDSALLASTDNTKEFLYKDGVISYELTIMGMTTTIELRKEN